MWVQTDALARRVQDYNYFDVNYPYLGGPSGSGHGLGAAAGIRVHDWFPFCAIGSFVTMSAGETDITILYLAWRCSPAALTKDLRTCARAGYTTSETDTVTGVDDFGYSEDLSASQEGYLIGAGIRTSVLPEFEFAACLSLLSMEDAGPTVLIDGLA